jgi:hypothetical protein
MPRRGTFNEKPMRDPRKQNRKAGPRDSNMSLDVLAAAALVLLASGISPAAIVRNSSRSPRNQGVFMVQRADNGVSYNVHVVWNAMSMRVWWYGKIGWRVRDSRPRAGVRSASIVMCHPFFQNTAQLLLC